MKTLYYIACQGQTAGLFSGAQLKQLMDSGQLKPTDLVCRQGAQEWVPASSLLPLFTTPTPVAVAAPLANTLAGPVVPRNPGSLWRKPLFLAVLGTVGVSLILNVVFLVLLLNRGTVQKGLEDKTASWTPEEIRKNQEVVIKEIDRLEGTYECEDGDRQKPIVKVDLTNTACTNTLLGDIAKLPKLQKLILTDTRITDAGLVHLKNLKELQRLSLNWTDVTDAGLVHLKELKNLQSLNLERTHVTDGGLVHLKDLKNLQKLNLLGCEQITDGGLVHLKELKDLKLLGLGSTKVTGAGIAELQKSLPGAKIDP